MKVALLVAAGGSGQRFGQPKQLFCYQNKPILIYTLEKFVGKVDQIIVVIRPQDKEQLQKYLQEYKLPPVDIVDSGAERYDSVRNGLQMLRSDITHVFVHDGARPNISAELFERLRQEVEIYDAVIPAVPIVDTVKIVKDGTVIFTPKRADVFAAQTPQCFRKKTILQAYEEIDPAGCTDDAMLVEKLGVPVHIVAGEPTNLKITTPADINALIV